MESDLERLDPLTIRNPHTFRVAWQIYEGLLGLTIDGQIEPRLAESWGTDDFQTWTFRIRQAQFHSSEIFGDGDASRSVTAQDVVWSYTAYCAPGAYASFILADSLAGCAEYGAGEAESVEGLRALDVRTIEMQLIAPEPFFLHRISSPWAGIVPKEGYADDIRDRWGTELAIGTGPYRLASRTATEVVLERNPDYWDGDRTPHLDAVRFRVIKSAPARLAALHTKAVDVLPITTDLFDSVLAEGELRPEYGESYTLQPYVTFNHHLIGFNLETVPDARLRRAMSLATDRGAIVEAVLGGFGTISAGPVPPSMAGYGSRLPQPERDLEAAKAELALSSYGKEPLELLIHDLEGSQRVGEIFQHQMRELGVDIELSQADYGSMIGRVIAGDAKLFSIFAEIVFSSPEPLLINLFATAKIPVPNFWRYSSEEVDSRLASLRRMSERSERLQTSAVIERQIVGDTPAIFLYNEKPVLLHSLHLSDIPVTPDQHFRLEEVRLVE